MTPEQESFERGVIWTMYGALKAVNDAGYSDWQTLTSFIANLLLDQDDPQDMLKRLHDDVATKMRHDLSLMNNDPQVLQKRPE